MDKNKWNRLDHVDNTLSFKYLKLRFSLAPKKERKKKKTTMQKLSEKNVVIELVASFRNSLTPAKRPFLNGNPYYAASNQKVTMRALLLLLPLLSGQRLQPISLRVADRAYIELNTKLFFCFTSLMEL